MKVISSQEARQHMGELLDAVARGEEIGIQRRGRLVARLVPVADAAVKQPSIPFLDHGELRESLPQAARSAAELIREMRDDERF